MLFEGLSSSQALILTVPATDSGVVTLSAPVLNDLGPPPASGSSQYAAYASAVATQNKQLMYWWLDRMVLSQNPLPERMTWFWHGHWATSLGKVRYALPTYQQNQTFRRYALANFSDMANAMVLDGALLLWLDANLNVKKAPNENLAREFMELFTLGVGNFTESDVRAVAKGFTGYRVVPSSGVVSLSPLLHESSTIQFLGTTGSFDATSIATYIVSLAACEAFIAARLWFRFFDSANPQPDTSIANAFATRDTAGAVNAMVHHPALADPRHAQAKSPVEWFVGACRALGLQPSRLSGRDFILNALGNLAQVPFYPPNVGGWPDGQGWLNTASAQYRLALTHFVVAQGSLAPVESLSPRARPDGLAMWLGVDVWSWRTLQVLEAVQDDPVTLTTLALNAPEYVVNA